MKGYIEEWRQATTGQRLLILLAVALISYVPVTSAIKIVRGQVAEFGVQEGPGNHG